MPLLFTPFALLYRDIETVYLVLYVEVAIVNHSVLDIDSSLSAACFEIAFISLEPAIYL